MEKKLTYKQRMFLEKEKLNNSKFYVMTQYTINRILSAAKYNYDDADFLNCNITYYVKKIS